MKISFQENAFMRQNFKKTTFRFLSILRDWRVHREARGAQGAFWIQKCIFLRFGAEKFILANFHLNH